MSRYISIYYASRSQRLRTTSQPRDRQRGDGLEFRIGDCK